MLTVAHVISNKIVVTVWAGILRTIHIKINSCCASLNLRGSIVMITFPQYEHGDKLTGKYFEISFYFITI